MSYPFKICDAIHGFIRFNPQELLVIDSLPFQRLRYIRQMGAVYLVYPGATHSRFEHSLGVMELATRIYNTVTAPHNEIISLHKSREEIEYWRLVLRCAALCHDLGHLPFSHTAEQALLPDGGHEEMTRRIVCSEALREIWRAIDSQLEKDIIKIIFPDPASHLTEWEKMVAQIIAGDNFGADRIDYLLRDSHYTGVNLGHFDYHQLIDCLRIIPFEKGLTLGVTRSGIHAVESLWIARYMMFARVYHHPKSLALTNHMRCFMHRYYGDKRITSSVKEYLRHTDYTLLTALSEAAEEGDYDANCLLKREAPFDNVPFKDLTPHLKELLERQFGGSIFIEQFSVKEQGRTFPVLEEGNETIASEEISPFLPMIPQEATSSYLYAHPSKASEVKAWLLDQLQLKR